MQNMILKQYCFFEVIVVDDDYGNDSFGEFNCMIWW